MYTFAKSGLTPLEYDLLRRIHARYKEAGFPAPENLSVKSREHPGFGRFTYFEHDGQVEFPDCDLGLGKFDQFDMEGLEAGACFLARVEGRKLRYLEILLNDGNQYWDGTEGPWAVCDPETGAIGPLGFGGREHGGT